MDGDEGKTVGRVFKSDSLTSPEKQSDLLHFKLNRIKRVEMLLTQHLHFAFFAFLACPIPSIAFLLTENAFNVNFLLFCANYLFYLVITPKSIQLC